MLGARALLFMLMSPVATPDYVTEPLTLERATEIALTRANEMIQAREDVLLVDANYITSRSAILPRFDVSMGGGLFYSKDRIFETRNAQVQRFPDELPVVEFGDFIDQESNSFLNPTFNLGLRVQQLIFDGGRWWTTISQAEYAQDGAKADLQAIANTARALVARAFFGVERARQERLTIEAQVRVDEAQVDRARALLRAGRGAPADVATAERNLASDQSALVASTTAEGQARRTLNLQMGLPAHTEVTLEMPPEVESSTLTARFIPSFDQLTDIARANHPELMSQRAGLASAEDAITVARAAYWPTVALEANYNRNSRRPDRIIANPLDNFSATVNLAVTWNVFEGFATNAEVERAQINLRKAKANYEVAERVILSDISDGVQRLRNFEQTSLFAQRQVKAAEEAVRLARGLYEAGRGTSLELRDAELGLTRARIATINARLDAAIAYADLVRAVGSDAWTSGAIRQL